jgi:glycosyltransferase involved in cell wall biosynthesis
MKILLTADPELPVPPGMYGGIERIVEVLVQAYTAAGHEVVLCAHPASQVPCRLIGWKGARSQHRQDTLRNMLTLTRLVYSEHFDVIHSFSRLAYMTAIFPLKVPKIMSYQREPSLQQVGKAVKMARKNSLVFTGCSDYIARQLDGTAESYTIYNCAPIEKYILQEKVEEDAPLMFLGRIEDIKGTHIAVDVARRTGKRLIIAGNIPADKESYFNERIKPFLDDRIRYIGPVNDEQKNNWLGKALAFVMAVQWNEPFGIVMAEAMACGTPVLGLPFGAVPEVVEDGINGYMCQNTEEMVRRVGDIPAIDRKKVRQVTEQRFSNTKIAADYLDLYTRLIDRMN